MPVTKISNPAVRFIKYWLPVVIYAILIFSVSSIPGEDIPSIFPYEEVVFHIIEYAVFAYLINRAVKEYYSGLSYKSRFFWVLFFCILYALSDEFHQKFVPNRTSNFTDISWDVIGTLLGNIIFR